MTGSTEFDGSEGICPKRLWVMRTLVDDEAVGRGDPLPQVLTLHLSRCESCKALADELTVVSSGLYTLAAHEPDETLALRAEAQATAALSDGAKLTGRVAILDEPLRPGRRPSVLRLAARYRYAAAAAIVLVVGLWQAPRFFSRDAAPLPITGRDSVAHEAVVPDVSPSDALPTGALRLANRVDEAAEPASGHPAEVGLPSGVDGASLPDESRLVETDWPVLESPSPAREGGPAPRRICRHRSAIEAAMCDNIHDVHTAFVPPRALSSTPTNRAKRIDKRPSRESTGHGSGGR